MLVSIDELCMCTNFGGRDLSSFGDNTTSQKQPNFPFDPWTIVYGHQNSIDRNWPNKFMQVSIDELCMCSNFGGRDLSGFGDNTTSQKQPNFPFDPWTIVHGHQKI